MGCNKSKYAVSDIFFPSIHPHIISNSGVCDFCYSDKMVSSCMIVNLFGWFVCDNKKCKEYANKNKLSYVIKRTHIPFTFFVKDKKMNTNIKSTRYNHDVRITVPYIEYYQNTLYCTIRHKNIGYLCRDPLSEVIRYNRHIFGMMPTFRNKTKNIIKLKMEGIDDIWMCMNKKNIDEWRDLIKHEYALANIFSPI
jgi:hypothetical protein